MKRTTRQSSAHIVAFGVLLALCLAGSSQASPAQRPTQSAGGIATYICYGGLGDFEVLVNEDRISSMHWDSEIVAADSPEQESFDISKNPEKKRLTMFPLADAKPDDTINYRVVTENCDASVTLKITDDPDEALRIARVIVRPESEREADERRREEERRRKLERAAPMADLSPPVILPDRATIVTTGGPIFVHIAHGWWEQEELFLAFDTLNNAVLPRRIAQVLAFDRAGRRLPIDIRHIQHTGPVEVAGDLLAVIPGGSQARGFLSLPDAANGDIRGLTIALLGADGETLATASVGDWESRRQILVPMSDEEIERQKRDEEARGRVSVQVHALRGYIWLDDGLGGEELDATILRGLGIRTTYGINRLLMLTGEVAGASSDAARFDGISQGGMQGVLHRTATLGRVLLGGQVSLGHRVVPYARLAVGFHGTAYDSELMTGNSPENSPDESFEIDGVWMVGSGVEFRLGKQFVAGGGFVYLQGSRTEQRLLELGAHFGVAWKP